MNMFSIANTAQHYDNSKAQKFLFYKKCIICKQFEIYDVIQVHFKPGYKKIISFLFSFPATPSLQPPLHTAQFVYFFGTVPT